MSPAEVKATHLMGGELTYEYDGAIPGGAFYNIKLIVYRYCDNSSGQTAALDPSMFLGIFINDSLNPSAPLEWYSTENLTLISSSFVTAAPGNSNCPFQATACIERGEYLLTILLPDNPTGYHLMVERCCRNGNIVNLNNPGALGMTYYAFVPPGIINSTPQIADISVPYICSGDTISIINNAFDPDGDSLTYSFVIPYNGTSSPSDPAPDPMFSTPYSMPIVDVSYAPGYSLSNVFGAGGYAFIDPVTGLTKYYIPNQGFFVAAIEIREYRNGVLISAIRRDLQFISIVCTPNEVPVFASTPAGSTYTIAEGQPLCFNVSFDDADGDSLYLTSSGPLLNNTIVNPPGTIPNATGVGSVTSQFCWTPVCGMSRSAPYIFNVTVTDNGCPQKITNQIFSVYVTANPNALTPTVGVSTFPSGIICQGSDVTFQATGTLAGSNPQYTWLLNGAVVLTGSDSLYSPTSLTNGDIISVTMISNAPCLLTDTAFSTPYVVSINPQPAPSINITSNPATNLCPQQICLFTANFNNAGATPTFQWNINGNPAGTNQPLFTAANPSGVMEVFVTINPSTGCPPKTSNTIVFNIVPFLQPELNLTANFIDSICPGEEVTLVAQSSLTGATPIYNWTLNGVSLGYTNDTLTLSTIKEGDEFGVSVTSSYPCLSPTYTYAEPLLYHIYDPLSANLTDGPFEVCYGEEIDLTIEANGGWYTTYEYTWSAGNSTNETNSFIPLVSGYYFATVDDICYNAVTDSVFIEVLSVPESDFIWNPYQPDIFNPMVQFTDRSIGAISWDWNLGEGDTSSLQHPLHEYQSGGLFPIKLVTTNSVGCTDTLVRELEVINFITSYIPNSFTPNGDGRNDFFGLSGFSTGGYSMSIFNRWGQELFSSSSGFELWDGRDENGNIAPEGTYIYLFKLINDTTSEPITGTVTLVR